MDFGLDLLTHNTEAKAVIVGVTVQLDLLTIIMPASFIATKLAHKCWEVSWSAATACTNVTSQEHRVNTCPSLCAPQYASVKILSSSLSPIAACALLMAAWQLLTVLFQTGKVKTLRARVCTSSQLEEFGCGGYFKCSLVTHLK